MMPVKRSPAKKVRISDLLNGKYFYGSKEELAPSYVITPFGEKVSRANLIGTVVEKFTSEDGRYSTVTVDDGTDAIKIKSFGETDFGNVELGDLVRAVGKVKEYNGEIYINFEIIKKVEDINLEILLQLEVLRNLIQQKKIIDNIKILSDQMDESDLRDYAKENFSIDEEALSVIVESKKKETDYKPVVLDIIAKLDEGNGVEISKLFEVVNLPENMIEKTINELINSGSVYEPKVGFLKKIN